MASTRLRHVLGATFAVGVGAVLSPLAASAAPGAPPIPTVASVTARLDRLADQTTALTTKFTAAQAAVQAALLRAAVAQHAAAQATAAYVRARTQLSPLVTAQYEQGPMSSAGALLTSVSGQRYVDAMATMKMVVAHRADVVAQVASADTKARSAQKAAAALVAEATSRRDALAKQRVEIVVRTQTFRKVLATLTIAQQQAYGAGAGSAAVQWAARCAQLAAGASGSVGDCTGTTGYVNPFAYGSWTAERTDQGTDWGAKRPQPVVAIGDGVITYSNSNEGGWPSGKFLVYGLTSGSHAGTYVFVAENLSNLLPAGTPVRAGQQIAIAIPGGPDIEMGFAAPPGTAPNVATPYNGAPDGTETEGGKAFARFLMELGVKPMQPPGPGPDRP